MISWFTFRSRVSLSSFWPQENINAASLTTHLRFSLGYRGIRPQTIELKVKWRKHAVCFSSSTHQALNELLKCLPFVPSVIMHAVTYLRTVNQQFLAEIVWGESLLCTCFPWVSVLCVMSLSCRTSLMLTQVPAVQSKMRRFKCRILGQFTV
jgi:hypothetical protein